MTVAYADTDLASLYIRDFVPQTWTVVVNSEIFRHGSLVMHRIIITHPDHNQDIPEGFLPGPGPVATGE